MKNKQTKETTKEVLTPAEKTVELIQEAPAKAKRKHYHKPKAKVAVVAEVSVMETPVAEVAVKVKKSWFQTTFPKLSAWLNK